MSMRIKPLLQMQSSKFLINNCFFKVQMTEKEHDKIGIIDLPKRRVNKGRNPNKGFKFEKK